MTNLNTFKNVWYATEKRAKSASKLLVYDDVGSVEIRNGTFEFLGSTIGIRIDEINRIYLGRQKVNWLTYLIGMVIFVPISYLCYLPLKFIAGINSNFLVWLWIIAIVFGLVVGISTKWVVIEHKDSNGVTVKSYFADGASHGWKGVFGGTQRMYHRLKNDIGGLNRSR